MITNQEILDIAMTQSAIDAGCRKEDFLKFEPVAVTSVPHPNHRKYLQLPFFCNLISYGNNVVASTAPEFQDTVMQYLNRYAAPHCFETPNLHVLQDALQPYGMKICFMAEYFLPDVTRLVTFSCAYELRLLSPPDFNDLYLPQWSNALCRERKELDILGVGAYDNGQLIGLAACSADCDTMWQIGVDVLPQYRRSGLAAAMVSRLTAEILKRGKVPFYCAAWSNIKSVRTAVKCGFRPAWVELTAKNNALVEQLNNG